MALSQEELRADHQLGIGGSEATNYLTIKPYGCPRKCWYRRSSVPPDYPGDLLPNKHMQEGTDIEDLIAEEWSRRTGRPVTERQAIFHPTEKHLLVHIDREIDPVLDYDGPGVLEIKSLSRFSWEKFMRDGLFEGYLRQMQHALMVTWYKWGAFAIHERLPDDPETGRSGSFYVPMSQQVIKTWDVFPNQAQQEEQRAACAEMWRRVLENDPPPPLPLGSKPCSSCAWREHCQGNAIMAAAATRTVEHDDDSRLVELQSLYRAAKQREKLAKSEVSVLKKQIDALVGARGGVITSAGRAERVVRKRQKVDLKALAAAHPELIKGFTVESTSEQLKVK